MSFLLAWTGGPLPHILHQFWVTTFLDAQEVSQPDHFEPEDASNMILQNIGELQNYSAIIQTAV